MATQVTTSFTDGTSSDAWQSFVNKRLLMRGVYPYFAMMLTEKKPLSQQQGKTMIFRRYETLARNTTALTEGVTPASIAKTKTDVAITVAGYGAWIENSDFLSGSLPEGVLEDVDLLSQNLGESMDALYLSGIWATGTNISYTGAATSEATTIDRVDYEDFNLMLRGLRNRKTKKMTPQIRPSQNVGTGSVMPGFWVLCSESVFFDIRAGASFTNKFLLPSNYGNGGAIEGEGGALDVGFRLLPIPDEAMLAGSMIVENGGAAVAATGNASEGGTSSDVHYSVAVGQGAGCSVNLGIGNGGIIRKALGTGGSADPLEQRASLAWKKYDGRGVLNQAFMHTLKSSTAG